MYFLLLQAADAAAKAEPAFDALITDITSVLSASLTLSLVLLTWCFIIKFWPNKKTTGPLDEE